MLIEALRMNGNGKLTVTGQLGSVMRESVDAAYSYVRSRSEMLGIANEDFRDSDLHIHFPAGAIPKDGPSVGAAITLAIASVLSRRPIRRDAAITGEVTLRGRVLEIGGVKEKVLAAYRAGLRQGDVITALNGTAISDPNTFRNLIAGLGPGTEVTLTIKRDGSEGQVRATLGEFTPQAERPQD